MAPTIGDGYIVAVDSSQTGRRNLDGKLVIAWRKHKRLAVSRLQLRSHRNFATREFPVRINYARS